MKYAAITVHIFLYELPPGRWPKKAETCTATTHCYMKKVKQSHYSPEQAQMVPGSLGSQIS